mmetsp:Transcript_69357/g.224237  ORF Transcript_69357/g.224237 Transcript_69357/m.224237 type:complete len:234 (+) Transcript_69357:773-1474(+)
MLAPECPNCTALLLRWEALRWRTTSTHRQSCTRSSQAMSAPGCRWAASRMALACRWKLCRTSPGRARVPSSPSSCMARTRASSKARHRKTASMIEKMPCACCCARAPPTSAAAMPANRPPARLPAGAWSLPLPACGTAPDGARGPPPWAAAVPGPAPPEAPAAPGPGAPPGAGPRPACGNEASGGRPPRAAAVPGPAPPAAPAAPGPGAAPGAGPRAACRPAVSGDWPRSTRI